MTSSTSYTQPKNQPDTSQRNKNTPASQTRVLPLAACGQTGEEEPLLPVRNERAVAQQGGGLCG